MLAECLFNKYYVPGVDADKLDELMGKIANIQDDFLCRVSANGDKDPKKVKVYYKNCVPTSTRLSTVFSKIWLPLTANG